MGALPTVIRHCLDEAVARSPQLVERAAEHCALALEARLRERGNTASSQDLSGALRELSRVRLEWRGAFPQALRSGVENPQPSGGGGLRPSSLTLVDDSQVVQAIETSRLAQQLGPMVERPLAELDALMSSALGLDGIQAESNPLRPEVFARALRQVMGGAADPAWPALWMRFMADPLAQELGPLYQACSQLLKKANVQAAGYRLITQPAALSPAPAPAAAPGGHGASAPAAGRPEGPRASGFGGLSALVEFAAQKLQGPIVRDFLARPLQGGSQAVGASYLAQLEQELAALEAADDEAPCSPAEVRRHAQVSPVERPMRAVGTDQPLSGERWGAYSAPRQRSLVRTRLKRQASQVEQVVGVDLVRKLVDQVAQDPRLLAPVREAVVALEPALGRLALHSPRFFGESDSPARRLVERVAERSFRFNDEFDEGFAAFLQPVGEVFTALNRMEQLQDAQPFARALEHLEAGWQAQEQAEQAQREQLKSAVAFAEQRQSEADRIARELSQRSDLEGVPAIIQDFLFGRWALVIAHARLTHPAGAFDPGGYVALVTDLLWSARREATVREPAHAFELIPRVVMKLREGMELIGERPGDEDAFFKALERLHRPVLKLRAKHRQQVHASAIELPPAEADLVPAPAQKPQESEELWLAPHQLRDCGFEDTLPNDDGDTPMAGGEAPAPGSVAELHADTEDAETIIQGLREGVWVDLFSRRQWRRAQLTWASARGTLFMFVSEGGRPHSMTRRSLQRLLAGRLLRPIAGHEVVQHAIDVLAQPRREPLAA